MAATGLGYPAARPAAGPAGSHPRGAGRPAVVRTPARTGSSTGRGGNPNAASAAKGPLAGTHLPGREIWWPPIDGGPYAGQVWAIETELTAKTPPAPPSSWPGWPPPGTTASCTYTAPAARPAVTRAAAALPAAADHRPRPSPGRLHPAHNPGMCTR